MIGHPEVLHGIGVPRPPCRRAIALHDWHRLALPVAGRARPGRFLKSARAWDRVQMAVDGRDVGTRSNTRRTWATMAGSAFTRKRMVASTALRSGKCATATLPCLPSTSMRRCQTSWSIHSVPDVARNESAASMPGQS